MEEVVLKQIRGVAAKDFERAFKREGDKMSKNFSDNLKILEEKFNESLRVTKTNGRNHFAYVTGLSTKTVSRMALDITNSNSRVDTLIRVAAYYNVPVEYLFIEGAFKNYHRKNGALKSFTREAKQYIGRKSIKDIYIYCENQHARIDINNKPPFYFNLSEGYMFYNHEIQLKIALFLDSETDNAYLVYDKLPPLPYIEVNAIRQNQIMFSDETLTKTNVATFIHIKILSNEPFKLSKFTIDN
jgi:transcriptional regulator with XRE-family HTH domain